MAQEKIISLIKSKLKLINSHKADLHAIIDSHVEEQLHDVENNITENSEHDVHLLKNIKHRLDTTLDLLLVTFESFASYQVGDDEDVSEVQKDSDAFTNLPKYRQYSVEFNNRLEALENFASEVRRDKETSSDRQQLQLEDLRSEIKSLQYNLLFELAEVKNQMTDLKERTSSQQIHLEKLKNEVKRNETEIGDTYLKKDDIDILSWRSNTDKALSKHISKTDSEFVTVKNMHRDLKKSMDKNIDKLNVQFGLTCSLIAKKLNPLTQLLRLLNDKHKNVSKTKPSSQKTVSGFTAYLEGTCPAVTAPAMNIFHDIFFNVQNHFNPSDGIYYAPVTGLYLVSLSLRQIGPGRVKAYIFHQDRSGQKSDPVCKVMTGGDATTSSGLGIAQLNAGHMLFVKIIHREEAPRLSPYSSFSCCLIQEG